MLELAPSRPSSSLTRRQFIYRSALAAAGATTLAGCATHRPRRIASDQKLRIAAIGVGGKGSVDITCCSSEQIVALCDADERQAAEMRHKFPNAKFYFDWRDLLEKEEKNIDAVTVSTPDHLHGLIASAAMKMGKHVYCQKPLTQTVYEARYLRKLAKEYGVITQMGNQGSSENGLRQGVEVVQAGVIGHVRQVHVWTNRPIWPQGITRPDGHDSIPGSFKWDLWLGPASERPFVDAWSTPLSLSPRNGDHWTVYHPFDWRGWFDFGTGALGDMACHTCNLPFRAAKLGYPRLVELVDHSELNPDTYPKSSKIRFVFPERDGLPETEFFWYDGNPKDASCHPFRPAEEVTQYVKEMSDEVPIAGCLLIGDKGQLFSPDDYGTRFFLKLNDEKELVSGNSHEAVKAVRTTIPRNPHKGDSDEKHHAEWIAACKGSNVTPYSNFDIAAYLTEIILLGCVALRAGKRLDWDGPNMQATNAPEASHFVKREYRSGWNLA